MDIILDLTKQYERVVEWNIKAGKLPSIITASDIKKQEALVEEEVKELEVEEFPEEAWLKELCDVFVVVTYLDYLKLVRDDSSISLTTAAGIMRKQYNANAFVKSVDKELALVAPKTIDFLAKVMAAVGMVTDIDGALNAVLDNNDLKIYSSMAEADEQMLLLGNTSDYYVDVHEYLCTKYYTVKRVVDGKIMKSANHPKCDLREYT